MTDAAPSTAAAPASTNTVETPSGAPNFSNISDSIAGWIEQGLAPLGVMFRTPWIMRFESSVQQDAAVVWKHASSAEGINYELGPWLRMQFPSAAPLPKEILEAQAARKQRLLHSKSFSSSSSSDSSLLSATHFTSSSFSLDSLLSLLGEEAVDGLLSTEWTPVPYLFSCNILFLGLIPVDRHELGLDAVWKERIDAEPGADSTSRVAAAAPTVAGFEERSQSILQRQWIHKRSVTHVDARAVAALSSPPASDSAAAAEAVSYTRVIDELEVSPRRMFFLLFPLLYCVVYLTFLWRHYRLRSKFGLHTGPTLGARSLCLKTKPLDDFAVLAAARLQDEEEEKMLQAAFMPVMRESALGAEAAAGHSEEEFELVQSPTGTEQQTHSDTRKDK